MDQMGDGLCFNSLLPNSINGHRVGYIQLEQGLRQGDPLSLYLYLFYTEGLFHVMHREGLRGIKVAKGSPSITHLLFANDESYFSVPLMKKLR